MTWLSCSLFHGSGRFYFGGAGGERSLRFTHWQHSNTAVAEGIREIINFRKIGMTRSCALTLSALERETFSWQSAISERWSSANCRYAVLSRAELNFPLGRTNLLFLRGISFPRANFCSLSWWCLLIKETKLSTPDIPFFLLHCLFIHSINA